MKNPMAYRQKGSNKTTFKAAQVKKCSYGLECYNFPQSCKNIHPTQSVEQFDQIQQLDGKQDLLMIYQNNKIVLFGWKHCKNFSIPPNLPFKLQKNRYYFCNAYLRNKHVAQINLNQIIQHAYFEEDLEKQLSFIKAATTYDLFQFIPKKILLNQKLIGKCLVKHGQKFIKLENNHHFPLYQALNDDVSNLKLNIIHGLNVEYKLSKQHTPIFGQIKYSQDRQHTPFVFFGKIQIVKGKRGLRFVPFDDKIDNMIVLNVNKTIKQLLGIEKYSFMMDTEKLQENIGKLSSLHFRGRCLGWPRQLSAPVIELANETYQDNLKSLVDSILFAHRLEIPEHSSQALKAAEEIMRAAKDKSAEDYKNHQDMRSLNVFTVDTNGASVFDDAFSIQEIEKSEDYKQIKQITQSKQGQKIKQTQVNNTLKTVDTSLTENKEDSQVKQPQTQKIEQTKTEINFEKKTSGTVNQQLDGNNKQIKKEDNKQEVFEVKNKRYLIGIHIADVVEHTEHLKQLKKHIFQRSQTLYIRNNRVQMFPSHLSNFFSLKKNEEKLACSLFFEMTEEGNVDFSTIRFQQTIIKVKENYSHDEFNKILQRQQQSMEKILQSLFKKREKYRKKVNISNNRASNMVENIMVCTTEVFNYLLTTNITKSINFQQSVESKLNEMNFERIFGKSNLEIDMENVKHAKELVCQITAKLKQTKVQDEPADSPEKVDLKKFEQFFAQEAESDNESVGLPDLVLKQGISKNESAEFDEFTFLRQQNTKSNQSAQKSLNFLKNFFNICGQKLQYSSIDSIKRSFDKLASNKSALFVSYIERLKVRNYQYFDSYLRTQRPSLNSIKPMPPPSQLPRRAPIQIQPQKNRDKIIEYLPPNLPPNIPFPKTEHQIMEKLPIAPSISSEQERQASKRSTEMQIQYSISQIKKLKEQINKSGNKHSSLQTIKKLQNIVNQLDNQFEEHKKEVAKKQDLAQKVKDISIFLQKSGFVEIFQNVEEEKLNQQINISEISEMIKSLLNIEFPIEKRSIQEQNRFSIFKHQNCQKFKSITWSNPIRQYSSVLAIKLIKQYKCFMKGKLDVKQIIPQFQEKIEDIIDSKKSIIAQNWRRLILTEKDKNVKNANIEIDRIRMIYQMKESGENETQFLIVSDPRGWKAFHPVLNEVELTTPFVEKKGYVEKRGKLIVEKMFPLTIKVELLKDK